MQNDAKLLIGGSFTTYHSVARSRIARLHPDGSLDQSFMPGSGANGEVRAIVLQPDGKVLIAGNFTSYNGTVRNRIACLHPDGTLDTSFDPGAGANALVQTINLLDNGKILVSGSFTTFNNREQNYMVRLNSDGSPDASFDPGSGANGIIHTATVQANGKVIIGGAFTSYNGTGINRIARLNADGSLDTSFTPGTGASGTVYTAKVQPDGRIVIGGSFTTFNGTSRARIARLQANGSLDTGFVPGTGASATVQIISIQNDGKMIVGGEFVTFNGTGRNRIARINADGSLDTTFDPGAGAGGAVYTTALLSDSLVIIAGTFTVYNEVVKNRIARLQPDGSLDEDFDPGAGANGIVYATSLLNDGKILIGGAFTAYNGILVNRIARIYANGGLDNSFLSGTAASGDIRAVALQPDGKIIIGGSFTSFNGTSRSRIARLNPDGSLDSSFDPGAGASGIVHTIVLQEDGKVLLGGAFTSFNGTARTRIARLNSDGSLDSSFDPGTGASNTVYTLAVQRDGKILAGGTFTTFNGTSRSRITRLHTDGSLDTGFNPGTGASSDVRTVKVQPDGKLIIGGNFTTYNGTARSRIARLNSDGSLDTDFNPGAGANAIVHTVLLHENGKILLGGDFTKYGGISVNRFARLNGDGSLDTGFDTRAGANGIVHAIKMQQDGKFLLGGAFTSYDGTGRNRVAQVFGDSSPLSTVPALETSPDVLVYPNPGRSNIIVTITGVEGGGTLKLVLQNSLGQQVQIKALPAAAAQEGISLSTATLAKGVYFLRISINNWSTTRKLLITD